jgi:hypothetical protein
VQEAFIEHYANIMNEARIEGDSVLFGDSVHPAQQTRLVYGWIKKRKILSLNLSLLVNALI